MICAMRADLGSGGFTMPQPDLRLEIDSTPLAVRAALSQVLGHRLTTGLAPHRRGDLELVLAEVLNNIVEHAYAQGQGTILLELGARPGGLQCRVQDWGHAMPGGALPAGQLAARLPDDLPEGGFGWHLIRCLTRDLSYARIGGSNVVTFSISETDKD